jgi:hypothetical protein
MKKVNCLLIVFLCCLHFIARAQNTDESSIRDILSKQSTAWNKGNIEGFMNGYWQNDSLLFIGKKGLTYGWKNTLDNYRKNYPDTKAMGQLIFTILMLKPLSNQYYEVVGKWHLIRIAGDLEGHFTLLFQKINGQWFIVMDHSS